MGPKTEFIGFLPFGTELFEYRIEQVLGHGGFGITYLARDRNLDKTVAIKEYLPAELALRVTGTNVQARSELTEQAYTWGREQFLHEARMLARFDHPNLIAVYRFFEANGTAYYVMDWIEGTTLGKRLKREGPLDEGTLRGMLMPLLDGLDQVHRAGILHRDLKPDNIMLRTDSSPVLIDFGAARLNLGEMTHNVLSVLTAGYAPLEQYGSAVNQGAWTDIYALGAVTYRMLSGKRPLDAVSRVHDDPLVPAAMLGRGRYSPEFLKAVDWALAVKPEDRPRSVGEWRSALLESPMRAPGASDDSDSSPSDSRPVAAAPELSITVEAEPQPSAGSRRLSPSLLWAMAFAVTALALLFNVLFQRPSGPAPEAAAPVVARPAPPVSPPPATSAPAAPVTTPPPPTTAAVTPAASPPVVKEPAAASPAPAAEPRKKPSSIASGSVKVAHMPPLAEFRDCPKCPVMVAIPGGEFRMGPDGDSVANAWEQPAHEVRLRGTRAMGRFEVTNREWRACLEAGACQTAVSGEDNFPVVGVDWNDAKAYTGWLSSKTRRTYRLPTEAEWEYALRAGTRSTRFWGDKRQAQCSFVNGADQSALSVLPDVKVADCDDGYARLSPAGAYRTNAFGLHDMAGNAWEWLADCWRDTYAGAPTDGSAAESGNCRRRAVRGGSWRSKPESFRSASRGFSPVELRSDDLGFRVVAE